MTEFATELTLTDVVGPPAEAVNKPAAVFSIFIAAVIGYWVYSALPKHDVQDESVESAATAVVSPQKAEPAAVVSAQKDESSLVAKTPVRALKTANKSTEATSVSKADTAEPVAVPDGISLEEFRQLSGKL